MSANIEAARPGSEHRRYLAVALAALAVFAGASLALNWSVDPLWYGSGNRLTGENFAFNERVAKLNRLLASPRRYDCLILGSSRATLLDAARIDGRRCFNLAFSGGQVGEFLVYARYLRGRGVRPGTVIVGVDGFNFIEGAAEMPVDVPDYVRDGRSPPPPWRSYLTLDALGFSLRTLVGDSPLPRYYRTDFSAAIRPGAPHFDPTRDRAREAGARAFVSDNVTRYRALAELLAPARVAGYVPPISACSIARMERQHTLEGYLDALHSVSRFYRPFLDFSIPSPVTARSDNTYDGSHYDLQVNARIAAALGGSEAPFGIRVDILTRAQYRARYARALRTFVTATTCDAVGATDGAAMSDPHHLGWVLDAPRSRSFVTRTLRRYGTGG